MCTWEEREDLEQGIHLLPSLADPPIDRISLLPTIQQLNLEKTSLRHTVLSSEPVFLFRLLHPRVPPLPRRHRTGALSGSSNASISWVKGRGKHSPLSPTEGQGDMPHYSNHSCQRNSFFRPLQTYPVLKVQVGKNFLKIKKIYIAAGG